VSRISTENVLEGALQQRHFEEHGHGCKRLGGHGFPTAVVGSAYRREKEIPFLDPMSDPGPFAFPLLKLDFTRNRPSEERFADGGKG
jgi:hypothetical protein